MNRATPVLGKAIWTVLVTAEAPAGLQDPQSVHYTCVDGTKLQATFSAPSTSVGSVKLVYAGSSTSDPDRRALHPDGRAISSTEMKLPQALFADGGRYTQGDVEF